MPDIFLTFPLNEAYCDFNQPKVVPSVYVIGNNRIGKFFVEGEDNLNEEMLKYAEISGSFDFLSNPEEDIYTFDDGESIC
ncbi:MAG: hypothetical protein Q8P40_16525 [Nitrospirota bacterium]|nr:hypothetical protein [Nitrospirota bacterium]